MSVRSFHDLEVWQKAMDLVIRVYTESAGLPGDERFGLTSQVRRAAVSIPSNIAEGHGRHTTREYLHFLFNARGSLCEVRTQIEIAKRLRYLGAEDCAGLDEEACSVGRLLNGLINALERRLDVQPGN